MTTPRWGRSTGETSELRERLIGIVHEATVGIGSAKGAPTGQLWGSGLLVAPGWVLTCAHVFRSAGRERGLGADQRVGVTLEGKVAEGQVAYFLPGVPGRATGGPDLALVALLDERDHSCVWLSDRTFFADPDARLFGRQGTGVDQGNVRGDGADHGRGAPDALHGVSPWEAGCRLAGEERGSMLLACEARIRPGISGGPLVDMAHAEVIGVVKARDDEAGTSGLGVPLPALRVLSAAHHLPGTPDLGPAPYIELLRRHDRWHAERQRPGNYGGTTWPDLQRPLRDRPEGWGTLDRLDALRFLAALPQPRGTEAVGQIATSALGTLPRRWSGQPRTWRDGHGLLYDPDTGAELRAVLRYLKLVAEESERSAREGDAATATAARELLNFVEQRAGALDATERARFGGSRDLPISILVEIEPLASYEDKEARYAWAIRFGFGGGRWRSVANADSPWGLTLVQAEHQVRRQLGNVLAEPDARGALEPLRLEVALDVVGTDLRAHQWRPRDGTEGAEEAEGPVIGLERPVVLRDIGRRGVTDPLWSDSWRQLVGCTAFVPLFLGSNGESDPEASAAVAGTSAAVPVLCRDAVDGGGSPALREMLGRGHAVAVWRTAVHESGECGGSCLDFRDRVREWLAGTGNPDNPDRTDPPDSPRSPGEVVRGLPRRLQALRTRAAETEAPECDWAKGMVLLYDDPGNPLPHR